VILSCFYVDLDGFLFSGVLYAPSVVAHLLWDVEKKHYTDLVLS
jgi:hypothetical protein